jgi:Transglycosylase SLT domain
MKINLNGLYKDVRRLVDAPVTRDVKSSTAKPSPEVKFETLLASISPSRTTSTIDFNKLAHEKNETVTTNKIQNEVGYARPNFSNPELTPPEIEPIQSLIQTTQEKIEDVKTPSLLELRRLKKNADFTTLTKPERIEEVRKFVELGTPNHGIDPALSLSIIENESGFDPNAVSSDGHYSKGLMQLLDSTGNNLLQRTGVNNKYDPFDPQQNVELGVEYLRYLHGIFGQETALPNELKTFPAANSSSLEKLAVAAYNAGEGRVASAQQRTKKAGNDPTVYEHVEPYLPESTREYVAKVVNAKMTFQSQKLSSKSE